MKMDPHPFVISAALPQPRVKARPDRRGRVALLLAALFAALFAATIVPSLAPTAAISQQG